MVIFKEKIRKLLAYSIILFVCAPSKAAGTMVYLQSCSEKNLLPTHWNFFSP